MSCCTCLSNSQSGLKHLGNKDMEHAGDCKAVNHTKKITINVFV